MKINRVLLPSTGLNRRRILSASATTMEEVQALLEWAANQMPNVGLDAILTEMETKAHAILKRYERNHLDQFTASERGRIVSEGQSTFFEKQLTKQGVKFQS
jgi:hypothetical protein